MTLVTTPTRYYPTQAHESTTIAFGGTDPMRARLLGKSDVAIALRVSAWIFSLATGNKAVRPSLRTQKGSKNTHLTQQTPLKEVLTCVREGVRELWGAGTRTARFLRRSQVGNSCFGVI